MSTSTPQSHHFALVPALGMLSAFEEPCSSPAIHDCSRQLLTFTIAVGNYTTATAFGQFYIGVMEAVTKFALPFALVEGWRHVGKLARLVEASRLKKAAEGWRRLKKVEAG